MKSACHIREGSWVRLGYRPKSGPQRARVVAECPCLAEGAVRLDRPLDGLKWWNTCELVACAAPAGEN